MKYLKVSDVAKLLKVCEATVRKLIKEYKLPAVIIPGQRGMRIREDALDNWLEEKCVYKPKKRVKKIVEA